jgi:hypothetical protein
MKMRVALEARPGKFPDFVLMPGAAVDCSVAAGASRADR